jgi:hypothetical protein
MATHDPQAAEACDGELHLDDGVPTWVRQLGGSQPDPDEDHAQHGRHRAD